jgi:Ca-activated chloride channel family protein
MFNAWKDMYFVNPWVLWLLPVLLIFAGFWFYFAYKKNYAAFSISNSYGLVAQESWRVKALPLLPILRFLALTCILLAFARPQSQAIDQKSNTMGIDLIISMDVSSSMLAQDFNPNRLEVAKNVASQFIAQHPNDRIGLVIYGSESFTQVPLTNDHKIVQSQLAKIQYGLLEDGTAIGMGLGTAVNRLKDSEAKSKVIILITDGVNNSGIIDPITATETAIQMGIKVYTIGIGTQGEAYMPYTLPDGSTEYANFPVNIDEKLLNEIANTTGGKFFRATNKSALENIYNEIDAMEKTRLQSLQNIEIKELFYPLAVLAILLVFIENLLKFTILRVFN